MKASISQYCLRMPRKAYEDALDVALVFGLSMNQFLVGAIQQYVESQMQQESIQGAVGKVREARQAGLARVLVATVAGGTTGEADAPRKSPASGGRVGASASKSVA